MASSSKKQVKQQYITNIRYPYASSWDKTNTNVQFEFTNINVSLVNGIRRVMLSSVNTLGFRTEDIIIIKNDTSLHNQIVSHRISMIPINEPNPKLFDIEDYKFIINVSNNTNSIIQITSENIEIKRISSNTMLSRNEVKKLFPPDPITGDYIWINNLKPKYFVPERNISSEIINEMSKSFNKLNVGEDVMNFHIEFKASISNATENGHYNPCACASYINTVDPDKALIGLKTYIDSQNENAKIKNTTIMTKEQLSKRFYTTEQARYFYTNDKEEPNLFTFKIETVGIIPPLIIFHRSIDIIKDMIHSFISNLISKNENKIIITPSKQLSGGYDIVVKDENDTLGNIIQSHLCLLFSDLSLPAEQRKLTFIGYKKPHPLENYIIFEIQGKTDNIDEIINDIIKIGCSEIVKMLNKIQNELEGTHQFINELKMIS